MKKYFSKNAVCDECGVKKSDFKTARLFLKHVQDHFDLQLSCSECPKKFATKLKLSLHVGNVHQDGKKRDICNQTFQPNPI